MLRLSKAPLWDGVGTWNLVLILYDHPRTHGLNYKTLDAVHDLKRCILVSLLKIVGMVKGAFARQRNFHKWPGFINLWQCFVVQLKKMPTSRTIQNVSAQQ